MKKFEKTLTELSAQEKQILRDFAFFPQCFSVDWFDNYSPSELLTVIMLLTRKGWIVPEAGRKGFYTWSPDFPREEMISASTPEEMSTRLRATIAIIIKGMANDEAAILTVAHLAILAGLKEEDAEYVIMAAEIEEKNHHISNAIELYDGILEFMDRFISSEKQVTPDATWRIFMKAIERRASLSLFHPSLKKINRFLVTALETSKRFHDLKSQASLELLIGQNHWMYLQYEQAIFHFDKGWHIIEQIEDEELHKRGLKVEGLAYIVKGQIRRAIELYEQSLGELECSDGNDFFHIVSLILALGYAEIGMPQRGLGITENIEKQCLKYANLPLLSFALVMTGMILLEIRHQKKGRDYFERALEIARKEKLPMVEALAGIGLSDIECQNGNFKLAGEHFKVILKLKKSNWFHILNFRPLFDTPYRLHAKGVSPIELKPFFDFVRGISRTDVNPLMYSIIQRLTLELPENNSTTSEKIQTLLNLEKTVTHIGATMELAKIRVALAELFEKTGDSIKASEYAITAWEFYNQIAADCFPVEMRHLIPSTDHGKDTQLLNLIVEMGKALTDQDDIEKLLTNIITSLSRLMGSERSALFVKDRNAPELRMIASRNLLTEEILEEAFQDRLSTIQAVSNANDGKIVQYEITADQLSDYRKVIIAPLKLGEQTMGILYQDSRFFPFNSSPQNMQFLHAFTPLIAISIDRAQTQNEIKELNRKLVKENQYYIEEIKELQPFGEILGESDTINALHDLIQKVAPTQSTVLIQGETGVGKELIARAIHRTSTRKDGPFIRVNCAALPDSLIDSELFGYEKGAFTGAIKTKEGRFELANKGTIFLDEVSELPLSTQSRLLRILQEKEFQRVGGTKTLKSDFRLIAATNKDLNEEVAEGRFRADLFFRLNVFPIFVPPLRDRKEDIPRLSLHFLRQHSLKSNKDYTGIPESEMSKLQRYSWPGNIRELSNMIERAVILGGSKIRFPELVDTPARQQQPKDEKNMLRDVEKAHIVEILKQTQGKISGPNGAAERLGLNRSTLMYRMKKLGIRMKRREVDPVDFSS